MAKKKKISIKEQRERAKAEKAEKYRKNIAPVREENAAADEKTDAPEKKKYNKVKSLGLKSTFSVDGKIIMTSFGRGAEAVIEKEIEGDRITDISEKPAFDAAPSDKKYLISVKSAEGMAENPVHSSVAPGDDVIGARPVLEKLYFGKNFDDNIHIQLIYNILDIEKLLAVFINNITYSINNVLLRGNEGYQDYVGYASIRNTYDIFLNPENYPDKIKDDKIIRNIKRANGQFLSMVKSPYLIFFAPAFYKIDEKGKAIKEADENIYLKLCLLGSARQMLAHSTDAAKAFIYNLDKAYCNDVKIRKILDSLYSEKVRETNKNFIKYSNNNLVILFDVFSARSKEEKTGILRDFYRFSVIKSFKNIGFSIKKLRENMLELPGNEIIKDKKYDTVRSKLNSLFDFIIYEYYVKNPGKAENNVAFLRSTETGDEKEMFYSSEAERVWEDIKNAVMNNLLPHMTGDYIKKIKKDSELSYDMIKDIALKEKADYFTEFIYLLTLFLDGKEINILLSSLINKFENIASFIDVIKALGLPCDFTGDYRMFEKSGEIADELRGVNSFARMSKPVPEAKRIMFAEAAGLLGSDKDEEALNAYVDGMLDKNGEAFNQGMRNFIANNVVNSRIFSYIIRYSNAAATKKLSENKKVVGFVLKSIPDEQIEKYYTACGIKGTAVKTDDKRRALGDAISVLRFEDFCDVKQNDRKSTPAEKIKKEQNKAIIRLYLTVLYLIIKNLININSRYFLAFHCLERDAQLTGVKLKDDIIHFDALTDFFIKNHRIGSKAEKMLAVNLRDYDNEACRFFRNNVMHLSAVSKAHKYIFSSGIISSYFALYHYIIQCTVRDEIMRSKIRVNSKITDSFALVHKHSTYCKDLVKLLNTPFGYNFPRYKNLSVEKLFDKNDSDVKEKK